MDPPGSEHEKTLATILGLVWPAVDALLEKTLFLYRSDGSAPFWIGDSPVATHNTINPGDGLHSTLGLGVLGIEIYPPISSELVLAHMCPSIATALPLWTKRLPTWPSFKRMLARTLTQRARSISEFPSSGICGAFRVFTIRQLRGRAKNSRGEFQAEDWPPVWSLQSAHLGWEVP